MSVMSDAMYVLTAVKLPLIFNLEDVDPVLHFYTLTRNSRETLEFNVCLFVVTR